MNKFKFRNESIRNFFSISFLAVSLFSLACSTSGVRTLEDNKVNLSGYENYQWIDEGVAQKLNLENPPIEIMSNSVRVVRDPKIENFVRAEVEKNLQEIGFRPAGPTEEPDFMVTFYAKLKDQNWASSWNGLTPSVTRTPLVIMPGFKKSLARDYRDGMVYLTFYDSKTRRPAWTAETTFPQEDTPPSQAEVATAINEIITEFSKSA